MTEQKHKGGRKPTGTVVTLPDGRLQGIVSIRGRRRRLPPFPRGTSLAMAEEKTAVKAAEAMTLPPKTAEKADAVKGSVSAWFVGFAADREGRGLTSVCDDRSRFANHIEPVIGLLQMTKVTRADIVRVVRELDEKTRRGNHSWKTASNVWVLLSKMFRESVSSKSVELQCREDSPCANVAAPDRGARKGKTYLFPSELTQLLSCDRVPLRWRRMTALGVYLGVRLGELDALEWADLDLEHGIANIHRATNRAAEGTKSTKSGDARRIRIEPALVPLLRAMLTESGGVGPVVPKVSATNRSARLRRFLLRAGVRRQELHVTGEATRKPLGWHDLRATSATWLAVRGDDPLKIMQRLGHKDFATTMLYVREAEQLREGFGEAFPTLPDRLLTGATDQGIVQTGKIRNDYGVSDGDRTRDNRSHNPVLYH